MPKLLFSTSSYNFKNIRDRSRLEAAGFELVANPYGRRLSENEIQELLSDQETVGLVAGVEPLTDKVLQNASALRVLVRCGVGMDNVDHDTASAQGLYVANTPNGPSVAVAELTLSHILAALRRVCESDRAMRGGHWEPLMGRLLAEQTVGIIGYGRIGRNVAALVQAFGAEVLAYDVVPPNPPHDEVVCTELESLLARSDVVTLHLPYSEAVHHIIGRDELALMKANATLVNTARGGLIDEAALREALQNGQLGSVALDCFEAEPYHGPLLQFPRVQVTSHMGSYALEARARMEQEAADRLVDGLTRTGLLPMEPINHG